MNVSTTEFTPAPIPDGIIDVHGKPYMADGTGALRAVETIPPIKKLMDEAVRKEFGWAKALCEQLRRFRAHLIENLGSLDGLILQNYGVTIGGDKGNKTYTSFDGLWQIKIKVQDHVAYGPELQAAKALFDECLNEWSADTRGELRSIVTNAFDTSREGQISRANIHALLKTQSEDERWLRGQDAIRDAVYVIGAKEYVLFKYRESQADEFTTLTISLASA